MDMDNIRTIDMDKHSAPVGGKIELAQFITRKSVEHVYGKVQETRERTKRDSALPSIVLIGMRAARARDPKLLTALEKGAEVIHQIAEEQYGRTMRDGASTHAERVWPTEAQLWREAYVTVDSGNVCEPLAWIYAMGAILAGLVH
jgi:hypothetical protein